MSNIVNFSSKKNKDKKTLPATNNTDPTQTLPAQEEEGSKAILKPRSSFEDIADKNKQNQDRLRREREKANKNVLRSYRIK